MVQEVAMAPTKGKLSDLRVGIVGGSIAGCTAAIELIRLGCKVTLWERTGEGLKDRGAGIGVPHSVIDTLIHRDLVDADMSYFPATGFVRLWRTAEAARYGYLAWDQAAGGALLNWGVLYRNLRKRVPDAVYRSGQRVLALSERSDGRVVVELADGSVSECELVVCADGYSSLGRATLFPEAKIEYAGYVLWRGFLAERELTEAAALESGIHCPGYPDGHGIFYFVPGPDGSIEPGRRLVNWGMYVPVSADALSRFMSDKDERVHEGSIPPGAMRAETEASLKSRARERLPDYYAEIVAQSRETFAYAIYDCLAPAYRKGHICLAGDAGAFARPHTAAGALKGMNDAVALAEALRTHASLDDALENWSRTQTAADNRIVEMGKQLGRALVTEIPDWSKMDARAMEEWFSRAVTIQTEILDRSKLKRE